MIWWSDFVRVAKLKFLGMTDTLLHTAQTNGTTVTIRWSCEVTPLWKKWIIWCRTQHIEGQHLNITHQIWQLNVFVCLLNNESLILWVEKKRSSQCSSMCPGERMKERVQHSQFWVFPFFFSIIHFIYLEEKLCYFLLGIKYEALIFFFFYSILSASVNPYIPGLACKKLKYNIPRVANMLPDRIYWHPCWHLNVSTNFMFSLIQRSLYHLTGKQYVTSKCKTISTKANPNNEILCLTSSHRWFVPMKTVFVWLEVWNICHWNVTLPPDRT